MPPSVLSQLHQPGKPRRNCHHTKRPTHHPRSRGVYAELLEAGAITDGSSPLARGLPRTTRTHNRPHRIIPARAGFTRDDGPRRGDWPDHPRSRGVYPASHWGKHFRSGSSPLARGLPAPSPTSRWRATDHPRSRGVYSLHLVPGRDDGGSSPLARGLHRGGHGRQPLARIIPARAGFTLHWWVTPCSPADHPRSRGVYPKHGWVQAMQAGSSPLARGLRQGALDPRSHPRIIPARAGFTRPSHPKVGGAPDHPRSRGVYSLLFYRITFVFGSSPLARGLPSEVADLAVVRRIIPARAGFTRNIVPTHACTVDHPRSRGVYRIPWCIWSRLTGSSPLARGLRHPKHSQFTYRRIIPARAGFTWWLLPGGWGVGDHPRSRGVYP